MAVDIEDLKRRLENAQESLDTELKSWLNPATNAGKSVIAGTCMALRNHNGGFLIIGIRDDGTVDARSVINDVRKAFHHDVVQEIISKYSSERFEVTVHFVEREGAERVMIEVPPGVRGPVICRTDLPKKGNEQGHEPGSLLAQNTVYVRTLAANGRPSTAPARIEDWPSLMETCFNNREADIGEFIRRQLSGINLGTTSSALLEILQAAKEPSPLEIADDYLQWCYGRFTELRKKHKAHPPDCGTRECVAVISGEFDRPTLNQHFMLHLGVGLRRYTGWAPWAGLSEVTSARAEANTVKNGWEAFIYDASLGLFDFSRIDTDRFCYIEALRVDLDPRTKGKFLDFVSETRRVAETLAAALSFAKAFCGKESSNELAVAFRWKGLSGRRLYSPERSFATQHLAQDDEVRTQTVLPVGTPANAIGLHVDNLVKPLFRLFGGWEFEPVVVQGIVKALLGNSL